MSDLAFFGITRPLSLAAVASRSGVLLPSHAEPKRMIRAAAPLACAVGDCISAFFGGMNPDELRATRAGACFVSSNALDLVPPDTVALVTDRPHAAFRLVASAMHFEGGSSASAADGRVDPTARVHPDAYLEAGVVVESGAIVGPGVEIGAATCVGACAVLAAGIRIGRSCTIAAHASLAHALVGDRVSIGPGVRIGQGWPASGQVVPNLGRVIIQNGVEIGANAAIDRGELTDTVIGEGCRVAALQYVEGGRTLVADAWQVSVRRASR